MFRLKKGFVHIYTGEGKGKTTAALGLGIRAAGCGCRVCIFQFFKDGKFACGEADAIKRLGKNFKFKRFNLPHPMFKKTSAAGLRTGLKKAIDEISKVIRNGIFDVVILDEILIGISQGFVDEKVILKIIDSKSVGTELVLTGRGATKKLIKRADYVTCMKDIKHPFRKGLSARRGVEF